MLLDRDGIVGAALDRGVVGHDHHLTPLHRADAGHDAGGGRLAAIQALGRERTELQERGAGVEQAGDALAGEQLATRAVPGDGLVVPAALRPRHLRAQLGQQALVVRAVGRVFLPYRIDAGFDNGHSLPFCLFPLHHLLKGFIECKKHRSLR